MARKGSIDKGLYHGPHDPEIWWIDVQFDGRRVRRRIRGLTLARRVLAKLRTDHAEGRWFPTARRRLVE